MNNVRLLNNVWLSVLLFGSAERDVVSIISGTTAQASVRFSISSGSSGNPFVVGDPSGQRLASKVARCVDASLALDIVSDSSVSKAKVVIRNHCKRPVAVLTGPVELRIRSDRNQTFPSEITGTPYVLFYVFGNDIGLSADAFVGDGARAVRGVPTYAVIHAGASVSFAVRGTDQLHALSQGSYRAIMLIPIAFAQGDGGGDAAFDLSQSVAVHNSRQPNAALVHLPLSASRLMIKSSAFDVEK